MVKNIIPDETALMFIQKDTANILRHRIDCWEKRKFENHTAPGSDCALTTARKRRPLEIVILAFKPLSAAPQVRIQWSCSVAQAIAVLSCSTTVQKEKPLLILVFKYKRFDSVFIFCCSPQSTKALESVLLYYHNRSNEWQPSQNNNSLF